jgi:hypothetical protein
MWLDENYQFEIMLFQINLVLSQARCGFVEVHNQVPIWYKSQLCSKENRDLKNLYEADIMEVLAIKIIGES